MKIVCDNCGAKYSIADEKVAGKVFKIRCKKCSDVIVVRGDQVASEEEEATKVFDYGGEAVWHVVVNGEQQGPYAPLQIGGLLSDGTIDWEAYVWKEGFDGWKPVRDVPELVEVLSGAAPAPGEAPAEAAPEPEAKAADLFGGAPAAEAAAPAAASPAAAKPAAAKTAAAAAKPAAADLFASSTAASPFGGGDADDQDVVASQPSPRVSMQQASMTGQRNENSVLFSLSNLQALATGNESAPAAATTSSKAASAPVAHAVSPGHATGEGSGLIDIRALASAAAAPKPAMTAAAASGTVDDLLSIGTGPALGGGLGAPILAPSVEKEPAAPNLKILYALVGVLGIGLVGAVAYMATREPERIVVTQEVPTAAAPTTAGTPATAPTTVAGSDTPTTTAGTAQNPEPGGATPSTPASPTSSRERDRDRPSTSRDRTSSSASTATASAMTDPAPTMAAEPAPTTMRAGSGDLDSLMNDVIGMSTMETTTMASGLPDQPSRDAVRSALGGRAGAVRACGDGSGGTAMAAVTFSSSGSVSSVRVTGVSGSVASCVSSAVRGARVPAFGRPSFNVTFPYRL